MEVVVLKNRNIMYISESLVQEIGCFVRVSALSLPHINMSVTSIYVLFKTVCILINLYYYFYNNDFTYSICTWTITSSEHYPMNYLLGVQILCG